MRFPDISTRLDTLTNEELVTLWWDLDDDDEYSHPHMDIQEQIESILRGRGQPVPDPEGSRP